MSSNLHAACDALGNSIRFFITAGQRSDDIKALDLIDGYQVSAFLADKGDDAHYMRDVGKALGAEAIIPPRSQRKNPKDYDKELYKKRNLIERMFNTLKHFRPVAAGFDKLDIAYLAFLLEFSCS